MAALHHKGAVIGRLTKSKKNTSKLSESWEGMLKAGKLQLTGDLAAAAAMGAEAAAAATHEHALREKGTTAVWRPSAYRQSVRDYLARSYDAPRSDGGWPPHRPAPAAGARTRRVVGISLDGAPK